MNEREGVRRLADWLKASERTVFFGGAGISTESGIPDFRSQDGLYRQQFPYPPEVMLSHSFFQQHPEEFFHFYRSRMLYRKARPNAAHLALAAQLQDHSLYREYEAVCAGSLREDAGTVDAPIGRHPADRKRMAIDRKNGRRAVTHWTVLGRYPGSTHIQCRLETGRTHQIRVHLASIGHPILGDTVYGAKKPYPGLAGQCLHARRLSFLHPRTGERVTVECPLPDYFTALLDKLSRLR